MSPFIPLGIFTFAIVVPQLLRVGMNIVTITYAIAATRFLDGISPYAPAPGADLFKYSPFFALLYSPFASLPPTAQAIAWCATNALGFWLGISRWMRADRATPVVLWLALALAMMELDGSLRYQQVNALLIGMMLFGLADYRDRNLHRSGIILALATNFKILPVLFVLFLPWRRKFVEALAVTAMVTVLAPALAVGPAKAIAFHADWFRLLLSDTGAAGLRDLETTLAYFGYPAAGHAARLAVLGLSLALLALVRWRGELERSWGLWIALGLQCLLLVSPRTESPTFVLASPCYLFLAAAIRRRGDWLVFAVAAFLLSISFNDLWPKALWDPGQIRGFGKTLGLLLSWGLTVKLLAPSFFPRFRPFEAAPAR